MVTSLLNLLPPSFFVLKINTNTGFPRAIAQLSCTPAQGAWVLAPAGMGCVGSCDVGTLQWVIPAAQGLEARGTGTKCRSVGLV